MRKTLFLLVSWLLLVVAAYYSGKFFWGSHGSVNVPPKGERVFEPIISGAANDPKKQRISQRVSKKVLNGPSSDVDRIVAANLFGNENLAVKPVPTKQRIEAPETRLKFELQGIFKNSNAALTRALIAEKGKSARSYKKQDQLPGNVILDDILDDRVLLRRAGRLESLSFPEKRSNKASKSKSILTYHSQKSTADIVTSNKQAYYNDPVKAFGDYGLVMDDEADGLRLSGGSNSKLLERAGLRKGDLIRSVNGKTLSDFKMNKNLVDSVVASGELNVEIERDGNPIVLSLPVP